MDTSTLTVPTPAPPVATPSTARPTRSFGRLSLGLLAALWRRDMLRLMREPTRWLGVIAQPVLFWVLLGSGMSSVFQIEGLGGLDFFTYFFPGLLVMVVLFTTIFAMMAVIEDREHGFLQQVLTAPGGALAMVLGKTAGVVTVAGVQVALTVIIAPAAGLPLDQVDWLGFIAAFLAGATMLTGLSFTMAWRIGSTAGYHAVMAVFLLPMWLISGAMFPVPEGWLGTIMQFNPMTYLVDGFRHALHGGQAPVALADANVALLVLAGLAVVTLALATVTGRRRAGAR